MSEKNDKGGNGGGQASNVIVTFYSLGAADPVSVKRENATSGQVAIAGFWLLATALWEIMASLNQQAASRMQEAAMMESIMKSKK